MLDRKDPKAVFLEQLAWIEKVAAMVCHKNGVWGEDAEDFASWTRMRLMEDDYAALRMFRGEAEVTTYLTTVVVRHFQEYRRERWGRWRPSAAAQRHGQLARELEVLVYRDGCRLEEAGERLRTAGKTEATDAELSRLLAQLPPRAPLRPVEVGPDPLDDEPARSRADDRVLAAETEARRRRVMDALARALDRLDPEERAIVRMHMAEGRRVADVARALRLEQKPLYRRIEQLRTRLRGYLEQDGLSEGDVRELLGGEEP